MHGRTSGLTKPTILLVDNAEDAMQPHAGLIDTLSRLLVAAPANRLRLLVTSRVPVPVTGGAGSFSLEPLSVNEAAALVSALAPDADVSAQDAKVRRCRLAPG